VYNRSSGAQQAPHSDEIVRDHAQGKHLRFPNERLATFTVSFGASDVAAYQVVGTKDDLRLDSAYEYAEKMTMTVTVGDRNPSW
jgi:hypothetical protein